MFNDEKRKDEDYLADIKASLEQLTKAHEQFVDGAIWTVELQNWAISMVCVIQNYMQFAQVQELKRNQKLQDSLDEQRKFWKDK